jgi:hypothetical protein
VIDHERERTRLYYSVLSLCSENMHMINLMCVHGLIIQLQLYEVMNTAIYSMQAVGNRRLGGPNLAEGEKHTLL